MLIEQRNGLIYLQGSDKPFTGTIQDTLKDQIFHYQVVNGVKDGEFKVSYKNGHVGILGRIEKGKNEGKWKYFYESGKIESEGNFKNDSAYGKWVWFYEDGKKKEEGFLVDGKRNGKWIQYDNDGNVILEKTFKDDEEVDTSN